VAPLAAPFLFSAGMTSFGGRNWAWGFCFYFLLGSLLSYTTTIFLFIPALFCLSSLTILRPYKVCLLGTFLGAVIYLPVTWMMYQSSGPDSGPPEGTYFGFLARSMTDPMTCLFPVAGLITAIAYCLLAKRSLRPQTPLTTDSIRPA
jgi:hypothetical protein